MSALLAAVRAQHQRMDAARTSGDYNLACRIHVDITVAGQQLQAVRNGDVPPAWMVPLIQAYKEGCMRAAAARRARASVRSGNPNVIIAAGIAAVLESYKANEGIAPPPAPAASAAEACPGPDCPMCSGEACAKCHPGPGRPRCEHDGQERHEEAEPEAEPAISSAAVPPPGSRR